MICQVLEFDIDRHIGADRQNQYKRHDTDAHPVDLGMQIGIFRIGEYLCCCSDAGMPKMTSATVAAT